MKVWDAETGQEILTLKGHVEAVRAVAFSHDGRVYAWDAKGKVLAWTVSDGQSTEPTDPPVDPKERFDALSPDGSRRALGVLATYSS